MKTRLAASLAAAVLAFAGANLAQAAQVSAAVGATGQGDMTYRIGLSFDWDKKWLESGHRFRRPVALVFLVVVVGAGAEQAGK